jgi:hypothetical protein
LLALTHSHAKELEKLDVLMREIIDIDVEIKSHEQTLKDLHQQVIVGDEIVGQFSLLFAYGFDGLPSE